jgi:arginine-tRNA-protein transferase
MKFENFIFEGVCPYLPGKNSLTQFFIVQEKIGKDQMEELLSQGWRKFGFEFFRPLCLHCQSCIPIRVPVKAFVPSKSQKRCYKKNEDLHVRFRPLKFKDSIYEIYLDHNNRFTQPSLSRTEFIDTFFFSSCPSLQSEYYLNGKLIAVGFLDVSSSGLSSVYFIYLREHSKRRLGVFSILKEMEYARKKNLAYYYLGYFIENNHHMAYKNQFTPNEKLNWKNGIWVRHDSKTQKQSD